MIVDLRARLDLNGAGRGHPGVTGVGDLPATEAVGIEPILRVAEGQLVSGKELTSNVLVINRDDRKD